MRHRPVSPPRSSNRTCRFPASGSPAGFTSTLSAERLAHSDRYCGLRLARACAAFPAFTVTQSFLEKLRIVSGVCRLSPITRSSPSSKAYQKSGAFPPPALPGFIGTMHLSDSRMARHLPAFRLRTLATRVSHVTRIAFLTCCLHYPGGPGGCACWLLPCRYKPSPALRRVGIRMNTFEACSEFTRVTARQVARPPKAAFVTGLRPSQLPSQTARQLPELTNYSPGGTFLHW